MGIGVRHSEYLYGLLMSFLGSFALAWSPCLVGTVLTFRWPILYGWPAIGTQGWNRCKPYRSCLCRNVCQLRSLGPLLQETFRPSPSQYRMLEAPKYVRRDRWRVSADEPEFAVSVKEFARYLSQCFPQVPLIARRQCRVLQAAFEISGGGRLFRASRRSTNCPDPRYDRYLRSRLP